MKKFLVCSILSVAASFSISVSSYAQGKISLDNYASTLNPLITYGATWGPGLFGHGMQNNTAGSGTQWTIGFYYALGDVTGSVANDPSTMANPSTLGGGLAFAIGAAGDTTTFNAGPGSFATTSDAVINGYTSGVITMELVVYNYSSYNFATIRGHSSAFTMTPATGAVVAPKVGNSMPAFAIEIMPEPSAFTLAGIGSALLMVFRRRRGG